MPTLNERVAAQQFTGHPLSPTDGSLDVIVPFAPRPPGPSRAMDAVFSTPLLQLRDAAAARVVVTEDDREIRTQITGTRRVVTGRYASRKAGRGLPFESMNERAFFMHCEVDTDVVDYRAQPFRFEFTLAGRPRAYIADCLRLLSDGTLEVVEVKNDHRALKDPEYAAKLKVVAAICQQLGWRFRTVVRSEIELPKERFRNVQEVQLHRHARVDAGQVACVLDLLAGGVTLALGDVIAALGCAPPHGVAIACAMMVQRAIAVDLSEPLSMRSRARAVTHAQLGRERAQ